MTVSPWTEINIQLTADEYFDGLIATMQAATQSIDIETYIFSFDALGEKIIDVLKKKSIRDGVKCRILIDGAGSIQWSEDNIRDLELAGISVKIFHPMPWRFTQYRWSRITGSLLKRLGYLSLAMNRRNHRKLCVIDGNRAWVGSMNISATHLAHASGGEAWRDCGVQLRGPGITALSQSFEEVWQRSRLTGTNEFRNSILLNNSLLRSNRKQTIIRRMIKNAGRRVWVSNAYFSPLLSNIKILCQAAERGVDVRIVTGAYTDVPFFPLVSSTFYPELLRSGVNIYEYNESILHSKVIAIDDQLIVGSSNLNHRSILHDLELDIVVDDPKSITLINKRFADNFEHAQKMEMSFLRRRGWVEILLSRFYRFLVYWL